MKTYRIIQRPRKSGQLPVGFESVECCDSGLPVAELLVPVDIAKRLELETTPVVSATEEPAEAVEVPTSAIRRNRTSELHVALPRGQFTLERGGPDTFGVWKWEMLCALIEQHNEGHGSADPADRRRMTTVLRRLVADGPWKSTKCSWVEDPSCLVRELQDELGHLPGLTGAVETALARAASTGQPFRLGPLLLVGPPGTGKSHAALRVAELLGLPSRLIDMAAQQTNGFLHGSDRHWSNATPGVLFDQVILGSHANPVIVLDELDKAARRSNFDPLTPLYSALEPATAVLTRDQCIPVTFDTSHVSYVATANSLTSIPMALLSRFEIVVCGAPGSRESLALARRVWDQVAARAGVAFEPPRSVLVFLAEYPPRRMVQLLESGFGRMRMSGRSRLIHSDVENEGAPVCLH